MSTSPRAWMLAGLALAMGAMAAVATVGWRAAHPHRNLVIFVADGLRYDAVNPADAPEMSRVRREGVDFADSHALFPTLTTPNASAIATGHGLGDTGDFANSVYVGDPPLKAAFLSLTPFLEDDPTLGDMNRRFGGNYLREGSLVAAARAAGLQTAVVGKLGPAAIQDVTARDGRGTVVIDDATGQPEGLPVSADVAQALKDAGLATAAPDRGLNAYPGTATAPGVKVANVEQQDWFARVAADVLLPRFKAAGRPFVLVFWSRDPDGTQHNQGDSLGALSPGIDGPTTRAAVRNADTDLARLRAALRRLGLEGSTDVVVTADHGFSTISKASATSPAARVAYPDVPAGLLPPGFLALDLGRALGLPVWEPNGLDISVTGHPQHASAVLGRDARRPDIAIGANGGSDAIWLLTPAGRAMAPRIADALSRQDYTGGLYAADRLGPVAGALPFGAVGLEGGARTPRPDLLVSFRSYPLGCARPLLCGIDVADTDLQQGQGIHGGFGRADTRNMMAAIGPDFRRGYVDPSPVANLDWAPTLAHVLGLRLAGHGALRGRVMDEALARGAQPPQATARRVSSTPAANGFTTVVDLEAVRGGPAYASASGAKGRTLGLRPGG